MITVVNVHNLTEKFLGKALGPQNITTVADLHFSLSLFLFSCFFFFFFYVFVFFLFFFAFAYPE